MAGQKTPLSLIPVGFAVLVAIAIVSRLSLPLLRSASAGELTGKGPFPGVLTQRDPLDPPRESPSPLQGSAGGTRFYEPPLIDPPSRGMPTDRGIRGNCPADRKSPGEFPLSALAPRSGLGLAVANTSTTFFIYIPGTSASHGEFVLQDERGIEQVYEQMVPLTDSPGIIQLTLPLDELSLNSGTNYPWYFSIVCDPTDRAADLFVMGWLQPVEMSPQLIAELENARTPLDRAQVYGQNGFWYPMVELLAEIQQSQTDLGREAQLGWEELLNSEVVNLKFWVNQPFIDCCKVENQAPTTPE
jgi:hypothetical protein